MVIEQSGKFSLGSAWVISKWRPLQGSLRGWCEIQSEILMLSASVSARGEKSTFEEAENDTNFEYEAFRKTDNTMGFTMKPF